MRRAVLLLALAMVLFVELVCGAGALIMSMTRPAWSDDSCPHFEHFIAAATIMAWPDGLSVKADLQTRGDIDTFAAALPSPLSTNYLGSERILILEVVVPHSNVRTPELVTAFRDGCPATRTLIPADAVDVLLGIVKGRQS